MNLIEKLGTIDWNTCLFKDFSSEEALEVSQTITDSLKYINEKLETQNERN